MHIIAAQIIIQAKGMMALPESSVCHIDGCLSYVHENEFIKLSMGMPAPARSWKYYEDNVLYCILLQVTFQFEKPRTLIIKHFTRHQKIYDLMV